ncbi:MAG: hypothetical protein KAI47_20040, partial [Deltaproteobacteria bacterium]|nr:hypothetical protein [Deltaproteobacteria bacterium]
MNSAISQLDLGVSQRAGAHLELPSLQALRQHLSPRSNTSPPVPLGSTSLLGHPPHAISLAIPRQLTLSPIALNTTSRHVLV